MGHESLARWPAHLFTRLVSANVKVGVSGKCRLRGVRVVGEGIMRRLWIVAACVLLTSAAYAETSDRYSGGGAYSKFKPAIDRANQSGELFRIRGACSSNCTMFLGLRNVCVERSARLTFHAGHGLGAESKVINATSTQRMLDSYNAKLRQYVVASGFMDKLSLSSISGARIIDEFGYPECPKISR
jgi:hypothetical protein